MLIIAGISIAVLFEILLVSKRTKSAADVLLTLWMFLISAHLFFYYLFSTGALFDYPFLLGIELPFPLLHGVFLYLYVASLTEQMPRRRGLLALHFVPAGAAYAYLLSFFFLPADAKIAVYQNGGAGHEAFMTLRYAGVILSGVGYVAWSLLLLRSHRRRILDRLSYHGSADLVWLQLLIWGMAGIWIVLLVFRSDAVLFPAVAVFVFLIGFFGIRQSRVHVPAPPPPVPDEEKAKYARSGLDDETAGRLYGELRRVMAEEALYTKSDLSLDDLASRLKANANHLSQIINEREGKNFYDYVNAYRVAEFRRRLADPASRNLTLLAVALDCGFNSKSSFNRHFKKVTGQTPSEYAASLGPS